MSPVKSQTKSRTYLKALSLFCLVAGPFAIIIGSRASGGVAIPQGSGLYVLDTNDGLADSQVLLVDTSTGKVTKTYHAGYQPDMALSPDGTRLYLSSIRSTPDGLSQSLFETYDTNSGALISSVGNPDSFQSTIPIYGSHMAMSPSGKYIYILKMQNTKGLNQEFITAFDTERNRFLKDRVFLDFECNVVMLPNSENLTLDVACGNSSNLRELTLGDAEEPVRDVRARIKTPQPKEKWGAVFLQPGEQNVAFVSTSGSAFALERSSATVHRLGSTSDSGPWIQRGLLPENKSVVYFGAASVDRTYPNKQDTIVAADPYSLIPKGKFSTTQPFFSIELSRDGSTLYAINPVEASITLIDAATLHEVRRLGPVGRTPAFAIATP